MSIYKDCDIRGVYPEEIDEHAAYVAGRALATLHPRVTMAVGGDVRLSTPVLKAAFIQGLTDSGVDVIDIGTIPTPALYWALKHLNVAGGATVTASHNPPQYNGIKFMFDNEPVTRQIMDQVERTAAGGQFLNAKGSCRKVHILDRYMEDLTNRFTAPRPLTIVVDAGNGAMSQVAPQVLRRCGYRVIELFCQPDGRFANRDPNPAEYSHLTEVCRKVRLERADFGVAYDGDGDRAVFIDDLGRTVFNEKSLTLFIRLLLKHRPGPVVYDQKSSSVIKRTTLEMGGEPILERSGHSFIKRRFLQVGAAIAGEVSGHFFFGELGYDDGLFATLIMAEMLAGSDRPLSALADEIVCPPITPDIRLPCPYGEQDQWLALVEKVGRDMGCAVSHIDGVRLESDEGWLLIRKSVTAEQITVRAEADTPEGVRRLLRMAASALPDKGNRILLDHISDLYITG